MIKTFLTIFSVILVSSSLMGQVNSFLELKRDFEDFEYSKVILKSEQLLNNENISDSLRIEIYLMKAISHYSLGGIVETKTSFQNILLINRKYNPNPSQISPVLVAIFDEVKRDYDQQNPLPLDPLQNVKIDSTLPIIDYNHFKTSALKNLLVPGWGQISIGNTTKGIITTGVVALNFIMMLNSISNTNEKESAYLNETNQALIETKFSQYNSSYKTRNLLITSFAVVWLYSQIDFLFFSSSVAEPQELNSKLNYSPVTETISVDLIFPLSW